MKVTLGPRHEAQEDTGVEVGQGGDTGDQDIIFQPKCGPRGGDVPPSVGVSVTKLLALLKFWKSLCFLK